MPSYFRQVPDFDYVNRNAGDKLISSYLPVKNLFKRGKLREDIFGSLAFFTKYQIIGDERPDNVAFKFYNDPTLDWIVLISNNILNIQNEWPMPQAVFDKAMLEKYGSYDELYNGIHHYEANEVKNTGGTVLIPEGTTIPKNWRENGNFIQINNSKINQIFSGDASNPSTVVNVTLETGILDLKVGSQVVISNVSESAYNGRFIVKTANIPFNDNIARSFTYELSETPTVALPTMSTSKQEEVLFRSDSSSANSYYYEFYDEGLEAYQLVSSSSIVREVTNYDYEFKIETDKRNIFILKPEYLNIVLEDMEDIMEYKKGGAQYVNPTLKKGDNIRLFE